MCKDDWKLFLSSIGAQIPILNLHHSDCMGHHFHFNVDPGLFASREIHHTEQSCSVTFATSPNHRFSPPFLKSKFHIPASSNQYLTAEWPQRAPMFKEDGKCSPCVCVRGSEANGKHQVRDADGEAIAGLVGHFHESQAVEGCYLKLFPQSLINVTLACHLFLASTFSFTLSPWHVNCSSCQDGHTLTQAREPEGQVKELRTGMDHRHSTATLRVVLTTREQNWLKRTSSIWLHSVPMMGSIFAHLIVNTHKTQ